MNDNFRDWIVGSTSYLIHYNKKHYPAGSSKGGQFAPSDGGGGGGSSSFRKSMQKEATKKKVHRLKFLSPSDLLYGAVNSHDAKKKDKQKEDAISDEEKKNVILDNDISHFMKNHNLKSVKGDVYVDHGYSFRDETHDYNVVGESSTKVWKEEVRSKGGVHIIQTHPTTLDFGDITHKSGVGIDKNKLKQLDAFAKSKTGNKMLDAGRKEAAEKMLDTYKNWSEGSTKKIPDNYNSINFSRDLSPKYISYGYDRKTGEPTVSSVEFVDKRDNFAGHSIYVTYKNGKPDYIELAG